MEFLCIHVIPSGVYRCALRAYAWDSNKAFHEAMNPLPDSANPELPPSPEWPTVCACGEYKFTSRDSFMLWTEEYFDLAPGNTSTTGETRWVRRELPIGAIYRAQWYEDLEHLTCPTDGKVYVCVCPRNPGETDYKGPSSEWIIDAYCANCDRKGQKHHCWCRHGEPPWFTVDKNPPDELGTCSAGAGSIWIDMSRGGWHGFLRGGRLIPA